MEGVWCVRSYVQWKFGESHQSSKVLLHTIQSYIFLIFHYHFKEGATSEGVASSATCTGKKAAQRNGGGGGGGVGE